MFSVLASTSFSSFLFELLTVVLVCSFFLLVTSPLFLDLSSAVFVLSSSCCCLSSNCLVLFFVLLISSSSFLIFSIWLLHSLLQAWTTILSTTASVTVFSDIWSFNMWINSLRNLASRRCSLIKGFGDSSSCKCVSRKPFPENKHLLIFSEEFLTSCRDEGLRSRTASTSRREKFSLGVKRKNTHHLSITWAGCPSAVINLRQFESRSRP